MMLPPIAGVDHAPDDALRAEQHVAEVRTVERVPAVLARVEDRRPERAAGVVHEDARRSELLGRPREGGVDLVGLAHVGDDAERADLSRRRPRTSPHRAPRSPPSRRMPQGPRPRPCRCRRHRPSPRPRGRSTGCPMGRFRSPCTFPSMKFSVSYPILAHPPDADFLTGAGVAAFCRTAERAGFDGIGFTDHPAPTRPLAGGRRPRRPRPVRRVRVLPRRSPSGCC